MTERGMLFTAPMVRALLDGSKTQTRRVVKDLPPWPITEIVPSASGCGRWLPNGPAPSGRGMASAYWRPCPYGQPGDRLWVRETWRHTASSLEEARAITEDIASGTALDWRADYIERCMRDLGFSREDAEMADDFEAWRPSIHMPRWASRILLEITGVRVERLQAIGEADARAEGVTIEDRHTVGYCAGEFLPPSIRAYRDLWESINGAGSWDTNPWVWVVEFKRATP
jgi:hypothetical protein